MKTLRLMAAFAAVALPLSTGTAHAQTNALADLTMPCVAAGAVASENDYGRDSDSVKIMVTYGFFLLAIDRDPNDEWVVAKQRALYRDNPQQFTSHYQACLQGSATMLEGARRGTANGLAALGYTR